MHLNLQQRVKIVQWYYEGHSIDEIISNLFIVAFEGHYPPSLSSARRVINSFKTYGCVMISDHKPLHPKPKNDDLETLVCLAVEENPNQSTYAIANNLNVSQTSVVTYMKKHNYVRPYRRFL